VEHQGLVADVQHTRIGQEVREDPDAEQRPEILRARTAGGPPRVADNTFERRRLTGFAELDAHREGVPDGGAGAAAALRHPTGSTKAKRRSASSGGTTSTSS